MTAAFHEDVLAERRRRWEAAASIGPGPDPDLAAFAREARDDDEAPPESPVPTVTVTVPVRTLPRTTLTPDTRPRCGDCGYRITRCQCPEGPA